jgi:transforming growth factor-beta-induced protein
MKFRSLLPFLLLAALILGACAPTTDVVEEAPAAPEAEVMEEAEEEMEAEEAMEEDEMMKDIVDIAVEDGRFTTLVAAVEAAGLVDALKGEGPLTVFAPTDDAFAALPAGTIDALLADIPALTDILLYHVVEGKVMAADVVGLNEAPTLQGSSVAITVDDGKVFVDGAQVIITDIEAANGVIHVIDAVIIPAE